MTIPLAVLAILSVIGGWIGVGEKNPFHDFLAPVFSQYSQGFEASAVSGEEVAGYTSYTPPQEGFFTTEHILMAAAICTFLAGLGLAWYLYYKRPDLPPKYAASFRGLYDTLSNKYYVDEFYGAAIIRPIIAFSTAVLWKTIDAGVIDGTLNETAAASSDVSDAFRRMQSGNIRSYAGWVAAGAAAVIAFMVWTGSAR